MEDDCKSVPIINTSPEKVNYLEINKVVLYYYEASYNIIIVLSIIQVEMGYQNTTINFER